MARIIDHRLFYKKVFYLDLRSPRCEAEVAKDIKRFGGQIESFLSKDINYVISDRPEVKPKVEPCHPETSNSNASMMSPADNRRSPSGYINSPAPSSPFNDLQKGAITSRGLALVQKAKQKSEGTRDVLAICNQWNIKVVHLQVVLFWIKKCKKLLAQKELEYSKNARRETETRKYKLNASFVKVEDINMQYRSYYKELSSRDTIFTSPLCRTFIRICADLRSGALNKENLIPLVLKEVTNHHRDQPSPINISFTPVIHKNFSTSSAIKMQFSSKMGLMNDSKENVLKLAKGPRGNVSKMPIESVPKKTPKENIPRLPKEDIQKESHCKDNKVHKRSSNFQGQDRRFKRYLYCEICAINYKDLESHLSTQTHKKFLNDPRNFQALQEIISTMPSLESFKQKIAQGRKRNMLKQQFRLKSAEEGSECPLVEHENCSSISKPNSPERPVLNREENFTVISKNIEPKLSKQACDIKANHENTVTCSVALQCSDHNLAEHLPEPHVKLNSPCMIDCCEDLNDAYDAITEEYVSASCSSGDSNVLPYLEDSIDNVKSFKGISCAQNVSLVVPFIEPPRTQANQQVSHAVQNATSSRALDLTNKTKVFNPNNATGHLEHQETVGQSGILHNVCNDSTALDLSPPSRQLSTIFNFTSNTKRKACDFTENRKKQLKLEMISNTTSTKVLSVLDACRKKSIDDIQNDDCSESETEKKWIDPEKNGLNYSTKFLENRVCEVNSEHKDIDTKYVDSINNFENADWKGQCDCKCVPVISAVVSSYSEMEVAIEADHVKEQYQNVSAGQDKGSLVDTASQSVKGCHSTSESDCRTGLEPMKSSSPHLNGGCGKKPELLQECQAEVQKKLVKLERDISSLNHYVVGEPILSNGAVHDSASVNQSLVEQNVCDQHFGSKMDSGVVDMCDDSFKNAYYIEPGNAPIPLHQWNIVDNEVNYAQLTFAPVPVLEANALSNGTCDVLPTVFPVLESNMNDKTCIVEREEISNVKTEWVISTKSESPIVDMPVLEEEANIIGASNYNVPYISTKCGSPIVDMPVLEPDVIDASHYNVPHITEPKIIAATCPERGDADFESQVAVLKQDATDFYCLEAQGISADVARSHGSWSRIMTMDYTAKVGSSNADIFFKECTSNEPLCLKNTANSGKDANVQTRSNVASLSDCRSESPSSRKDENCDLHCEYPKALSQHLEADVKVRDFSTQMGALNTAFNSNLSKLCVDTEFPISENTGTPKWVSECDISSDSEPEWQHMKDNVDILCQELEKLSSDPYVVTEFPLNLALT